MRHAAFVAIFDAFQTKNFRFEKFFGATQNFPFETAQDLAEISAARRRPTSAAVLQVRTTSA